MTQVHLAWPAQFATGSPPLSQARSLGCGLTRGKVFSDCLFAVIVHKQSHSIVLVGHGVRRTAHHEANVTSHTKLIRCESCRHLDSVLDAPSQPPTRPCSSVTDAHQAYRLPSAVVQQDGHTSRCFGRRRNVPIPPSSPPPSLPPHLPPPPRHRTWKCRPCLAVEKRASKFHWSKCQSGASETADVSKNSVADGSKSTGSGRAEQVACHHAQQFHDEATPAARRPQRAEQATLEKQIARLNRWLQMLSVLNVQYKILKQW